MSATQPQPFRDLIDESLEESAFLWTRWESELASLTRNLHDIWNWTEDRLLGALDGVRVAPPDMFASVLSAGLTSDDLAQVTVAAHLLATANTTSAHGVLCDVLRQASGPKLDACMRGLEVADGNVDYTAVTRCLLAGSAEHAAALCRLKAFHRAPLGPELAQAFDAGVPALQATALRAAAHLPPDPKIDGWINASISHGDVMVREAALVTGIRRRNTAAWAAAVAQVRAGTADCAPLLALVASLGGAAEQQAVMAAVARPELRKTALYALGHVGTRDAVAACLEAAGDAACAAAAGEAYCAITGAELERDGLLAAAGPEPAGTVPFEEDDLDADLVPRGDATWPVPGASLLRSHWEGIQARLAPAVRHLQGRPVDVATLSDFAETGPMLRRPDIILELQIRSQGKYDVEPRAFSARQRRMMAAARAQAAA